MAWVNDGEAVVYAELDAITGYNNNYILPENLAPGEENPWGTPTSLVSPRFAQFSLQVRF